MEKEINGQNKVDNNGLCEIKLCCYFKRNKIVVGEIWNIKINKYNYKISEIAKIFQKKTQKNTHGEKHQIKTYIQTKILPDDPANSPIKSDFLGLNFI